MVSPEFEELSMVSAELRIISSTPKINMVGFFTVHPLVVKLQVAPEESDS